MRAKEVLNLLNISRPTLSKYVKNQKIRYEIKHNGFYDYNDDDVYRLLNKNIERVNVIYSRVSTLKQKKDLKNQTELLKNYCFKNGLIINYVYEDIASGISFKKRKSFFAMLDLILQYKVNKVIITYKDRLSRVAFDLFKFLFQKFGTEIIVISEIGNEQLDSKEIFEEIISLLHCYSMKMYSKRKHKIIKELIKS